MRNSSLIKRFCAENVTGLKHTTETADASNGTKSRVLFVMLLKKEKEQPEQKSHFLPGAMRKNRRFCLITCVVEER